MYKKLSELEVDDRAVIVKIEGSGEILRRLLDMGLRSGVHIRLKNIAPLGDPICICMRGFDLSLRKEEADFIFVEKKEGTCCGKGKKHRNRHCRES